MATIPTIMAGIVLKRTPMAGAEKVTFARCLKWTEGGFFIRVKISTKSQIRTMARIKMMATKLKRST